MKRLLSALLPAPSTVDLREQLRAAFGALLGISITGLVGLWATAHLGTSLWLVAPMGASAVLVFAVPASPLAQPWAVVGGNTVSAAIGLFCASLVPEPALAAGLAVGSAIFVMFKLRCLHPPGGASALLAVLMHASQQRLALGVVLLNAILLASIGMLYNTWTGRRYPAAKQLPTANLQSASRFTQADLDNALARFKGGLLDVSREDLEAVLDGAHAAAFQRQLGAMRCQDIMSRQLVTGTCRTTVAQARLLMHSRSIKALPVVDGQQQLLGIVTQADLQTNDDQAELAAMMTRGVRVARSDSPVLSLLPLFSEGGHHHIPIVEAGERVVGIVTPRDFVQALNKATSGT